MSCSIADPALNRVSGLNELQANHNGSVKILQLCCHLQGQQISNPRIQDFRLQPYIFKALFSTREVDFHSVVDIHS